MCLAGLTLLVGWGARGGVTALGQALVSAGGANLIVGNALVAQWSGRGCWKVFDAAPLRTLGRWSYGIYLVSLPLVYALLPGLAPARRPVVRLVLGLTVVLPATLVAAAASYYLIERPSAAVSRAERGGVRQRAGAGAGARRDVRRVDLSPGSALRP